jgi:pyruvyl transferase EpsO
MPLKSHAALIAELNDKVHDCLKDLVSDEEPLAILDFPDYSNCGDSAIWLGQLAYLRTRHRADPAYVAGIADFSPSDLRRRAAEGPIMLTGGGNFGDLWEAHQDFRELVMEQFPDRRIIQFPQSIHYRSPARAEITARVIGRHRNFVLLVRDEESKHFAEQQFDCEVRLCPDMALCIGTIEPAEAEFPVLAMLRTDQERAADPTQRSCDPGVPVEDWVGEAALPVRVATALGTVSAILAGRAGSRRLARQEAAARQRLGRGIRQLSRGRAIVTDRLHVHLCSLLLGRPHAVLDNSYGKVRRFMSAFSGGTDLAYLATSLDDGIAWARERAAQGPAA